MWCEGLQVVYKGFLFCFKAKLSSGKYRLHLDFLSDMNLMFVNCKEFLGAHDEGYLFMLETLEEAFRKKFGDVFPRNPNSSDESSSSCSESESAEGNGNNYRSRLRKRGPATEKEKDNSNAKMLEREVEKDRVVPGPSSKSNKPISSTMMTDSWGEPDMIQDAMVPLASAQPILPPTPVPEDASFNQLPSSQAVIDDNLLQNMKTESEENSLSNESNTLNTLESRISASNHHHLIPEKDIKSEPSSEDSPIIQRENTNRGSSPTLLADVKIESHIEVVDGEPVFIAFLPEDVPCDQQPREAEELDIKFSRDEVKIERSLETIDGQSTFIVTLSDSSDDEDAVQTPFIKKEPEEATGVDKNAQTGQKPICVRIKRSKLKKPRKTLDQTEPSQIDNDSTTKTISRSKKVKVELISDSDDDNFN
jgi:hypothetical protein